MILHLTSILWAVRRVRGVPKKASDRFADNKRERMSGWGETSFWFWLLIFLYTQRLLDPNQLLHVGSVPNPGCEGQNPSELRVLSEPLDRSENPPGPNMDAIHATFIIPGSVGRFASSL